MLPPVGRLTVCLIDPTPAASAHCASTAEHLHSTSVSAAGKRSRISAPATASGPVFRTTIVNESGLPRTNVPADAVLVTARSTRPPICTFDEPMLFAALGSAVLAPTRALFVIVPARGAVTTSVTIAVAPDAS